MFFDYTYGVLVLRAVLFALGAGARVNGAFRKYQQRRSRRGITGYAAARAVLDSEISPRLTEMSRYLARGDLNSLSDGSAALKGLILRRMSSEAENQALDQHIEALPAQIEALQADASYDTTVAAAGKSGYFSGAVDGYASVLTVDRLSPITAAEPAAPKTATVSPPDVSYTASS